MNKGGIQIFTTTPLHSIIVQTKSLPRDLISIIRHLIYGVILITAILILFVGVAQAGDWPMRGHDVSRAGVADEVVEPPLELLWNYKTGDAIISSPAVFDGVVYIGSNDGYLYALNARTGSLIWKYETGDAVRSSPAVFEGVVYVGSFDGYLYAVDARTGSLIWKYKTGGAVRSSPAVFEGVVYVGSLDNKTYAIDARTGSLKWKYKTSDRFKSERSTGVPSSPAISGGLVFVGSLDDDHVYALDAETGSLVWKYEIINNSRYGSTDFVTYSPAVSDGIVYVGSPRDAYTWTRNVKTGYLVSTLESYLFALDAKTGNLKWKYETGYSVDSSPAVYEGVVYVGSVGVYALDADTGNLIWKYEPHGYVYSSPTVSGNVVYVASNNDYMYALDAKTGSLKWKYEIGGSLFSSPAVSGGMVYVGSKDGYVYAFGSSKALSTVTAISASTTNPIKVSPSPIISITVLPTSSPSEPERNWIIIGGIVTFILISIVAIRRRRLKKGIIIHRTVYDPMTENFVSDKGLDYQVIKGWITSHPPIDYWYILRIDNTGGMAEQWAVELDTHIALSVKEAYIDGFERSLPLNKEHIQWKDKYVLRVPKELGIPLPSNGTRRLYFRLNIDCTTALLPRYAISGRVIANGVAPIPEKDFPYSCELRKLKEVWIKKPKEVEKYVDSKAKELYSLDAARAIADALRLYNEVNKLVEQEYVEENKLRNSIKNLRASLENVKALTGAERPLELIDESFAVMETVSAELAIKRWKEMNLFDVVMIELLKERR